MDLETIRKQWSKVSEEVAKIVTSKTASVADIAQAFAFAREVEKTLDPKDKSGLVAIAKDRLITAVKEMGHRTDGASTVLSTGGWKLMMHPTRTGLDPRKFEARLIAMKKNVTQFMKMVPTYVIDEDLVAKAVKMKVFTQKDLAEMQYDESWTLKTPTEE